MQRRPVRTPRHLVALLAAAAAAFTALAGVVVGPTSAGAATRAPAAAVPATPTDLPAQIESEWIPYVAQDSCTPAFKRGTRKLVALLHRTYPDVSAQGAYACGTDGSVSEHYEGRAIDWMASVDNRKQHAEARALIKWLLATDGQGDRFAMARRLGVMYLIYDNRIWGGWDGTWEPYSTCAKTPQAAYDNACHRTHLHISLTWNGAMGRTSFWTGRTTPTDYGPCRARGLSWASMYRHYNPTPCADKPGPKLPRHTPTAVKQVATYSGAHLRHGSTGPAVSALQAVLHIGETGYFGRRTTAAVRTFQRHHRLHATGTMNVHTWWKLLDALTADPARAMHR